jgi:hypothetical protein
MECELSEGLTVGKYYRGHVMEKSFPCVVINIQDDGMVLKNLTLYPLSMPVAVYDLVTVLGHGTYINRVTEVYEKEIADLEDRHRLERDNAQRNYLNQLRIIK